MGEPGCQCGSPSSTPLMCRPGNRGQAQIHGPRARRAGGAQTAGRRVVQSGGHPGRALFSAASDAGIVTIPPAWWLLAVVLGTLVAVAGLTAVSARTGTRRPVAEILRSETA